MNASIDSFQTGSLPQKISRVRVHIQVVLFAIWCCAGGVRGFYRSRLVENSCLLLETGLMTDTRLNHPGSLKAVEHSEPERTTLYGSNTITALYDSLSTFPEEKQTFCQTDLAL